MTTALQEVQAAALVTVSLSIDEYAASIVVDAYGEQRQYERDSHMLEHLRGLATHMREAAERLLCDG